MVKVKGSADLWLSCLEVAELELRTVCAIVRGCRLRKYRKVRRVRGHGGGNRGQVWLIALSDPGISEAARERFFLKNIIGEAMESRIAAAEERILARIEELLG